MTRAAATCPAAGQDLVRAFPALAALDAPARETLLGAARPLTLGAGELVFEAGQPCRQYLLIQDGSVRVHLLDPEGREIVLYRIGRGETCILTAAALLGEAPYSAYAVTEGPAAATVLSAHAFERLIAQSPSFRRFVFAAHARRIADLMLVVTDVAFIRVQVRLARRLLERAGADGRVEMTHEAIAAELGTAREVVSRNLKALERQGCVRLGLGWVLVADARRLAQLGEGEGA